MLFRSHINLFSQYQKRFVKKKQGKPREIQILMSRSFSTAVAILGELMEFPRALIESELLSFNSDPAFSDIAKQYMDKIMLATENADKFIFSLHAFYNDIAAQYREPEQLYRLGQFLSHMARIDHENRAHIINPIADAYMDLLIQTHEYIRPDRCNVETYTYGVSTTGEVLFGPCPYPYSDVPALNIVDDVVMGRLSNDAAANWVVWQKKYKEVGLHFNSIDDISSFEAAQRVFTSTLNILFPFINEYTFDIIAKESLLSVDCPLQLFTSSPLPATLKEQLKRRKRTLPANGVDFTFLDPTNELFRLLLKEVIYRDNVYVLYRLDLNIGSISGYYEPHTGFVWTPLRNDNIYSAFDNFLAILLSLYASQVLDKGQIGPLCELFQQDGLPVSVIVHENGGELEAICKVSPSPSDKTFKYIGATANGQIRRAPRGVQIPKAVRDVGIKYGYDLAENEYYDGPGQQTESLHLYTFSTTN